MIGTLLRIILAHYLAQSLNCNSSPSHSYFCLSPGPPGQWHQQCPQHLAQYWYMEGIHVFEWMIRISWEILGNFLVISFNRCKISGTSNYHLIGIWMRAFGLKRVLRNGSRVRWRGWRVVLVRYPNGRKKGKDFSISFLMEHWIALHGVIGWRELRFSLLGMGSNFDWTLANVVTWKSCVISLILYALICKIVILGTMLSSWLINMRKVPGIVYGTQVLSVVPLSYIYALTHPGT